MKVHDGGDFREKGSCWFLLCSLTYIRIFHVEIAQKRDLHMLNILYISVASFLSMQSGGELCPRLHARTYRSETLLSRGLCSLQQRFLWKHSSPWSQSCQRIMETARRNPQTVPWWVHSGVSEGWGDRVGDSTGMLSNGVLTGVCDPGPFTYLLQAQTPPLSSSGWN